MTPAEGQTHLTSGRQPNLGRISCLSSSLRAGTVDTSVHGSWATGREQKLLSPRVVSVGQTPCATSAACSSAALPRARRPRGSLARDCLQGGLSILEGTHGAGSRASL